MFWLVDPDGGRFLSKGVNTVRFDQDHVGNTDRVPYADTCREKYGSQYIWRAAAANRLASWKFNTLGCWSDELVASAGSSLLATTPTAALGASFRLHRRDEIFPDVFDPAFSGHIRESANNHCTKRRNEAGLLGTFIDNELYWSPDWRGADELLTLFLNLPCSPPWPRRSHHEVGGALSGIFPIQRGLAHAGAIMGGIRHDRTCRGAVLQNAARRSERRA